MAVSQSAIPARIADLRAEIASYESEITAREAERAERRRQRTHYLAVRRGRASAIRVISPFIRASALRELW